MCCEYCKDKKTVKEVIEEKVHTKKLVKKKKIKTKRKPSLYNQFVQGRMKDNDVKKLPHKEKMKFIGREWQKLKR
jgi:hypothetical protein